MCVCIYIHVYIYIWLIVTGLDLSGIINITAFGDRDKLRRSANKLRNQEFVIFQNNGHFAKIKIYV